MALLTIFVYINDFNYVEKDKASIGNLMLNLDTTTLIPQEAFELVRKF